MAQNDENQYYLRDLTSEESKAMMMRNKKNQYVKLIEEFLKSDKQIVKVETGDTPPATVYYGLRRIVKRLGYDVEVRGLNRGVVLVKKEYSESQT